MTTCPGRNDPCPCGSGLKYKKCCLQTQLVEVGSRLTLRSARHSAMEQLLRFGFGPQLEGDHAIAEVLFWADRLAGRSIAAVKDLVGSDDARSKYNAWFLFDLDIDAGGTVADLFLADRGARLGPSEREYLERVRRAPLALYEIQSVEQGRGVDLLDLWAGTRMFVHEQTATESLVCWDLLGARVVPDGAGSLLFEGGLYLYPASAKHAILQELKRLHRQFVKHTPAADDAAFFRRHGMIFHHLWLDYVIFPPRPDIRTTEGHKVVLTRSAFDIRDGDALRAAFAGRDDLDTQDDGSFAWIEDAGTRQRLLGTFVISGRRLTLESTSKERAARGRAWVERVAGSAVAYRATAYETVDRALERAVPVSREPQVPADVEALLLRELYDRHYRDWLDLPLPALKNRTPRAAARLKSLRPVLIDLLKQLENGNERQKQKGRPGYDPAWLWQALGLSRPE